MRIGVVRYALDPDKGGGERYAWLLLRHLLLAGYEVDLFGYEPPPELPPGLRFHRVAAGRHPHSLRPLLFTRAARRVISTSTPAPDALLALSRHHPADVFRLGDPPHAAWLEQRNPQPLRRALARLHPRHQVLLRLEQRLFHGGARAFIANSELARQAVIRAYGADPATIHVLRNPVDHDRFHDGHGEAAARWREERGFDADHCVITFAGMNYYRKGLPEALAALAVLAAEADLPPWTLIVAGPEIHRPAMEARAHALGLAERVRFIGTCRRMEILLAASDVLVLPTLFDPCANVVLEAMASGCVPITTITNGACELIEDGVNGFRCGAPRDGERLVEALRRALTADRPRMAAAARERMRTLTWEHHTQEVVSILANAKRG